MNRRQKYKKAKWRHDYKLDSRDWRLSGFLADCWLSGLLYVGPRFDFIGEMIPDSDRRDPNPFK